jgi:hypothetical protein
MTSRRWVRAGAGLAALSGLIVTMLAMPSPARAQEVNLATLDDAQASRAYVRTGAEYGFVAGIGYARTVRLLGRSLLVSGELTAPWARIDASDFRLRAGVLAPMVGAGRWKLAGALAPTLRRTSNELGRMTSLGGDLGVSGGYYAPRWFLAGELGFDWAMTTRIAHSELYRTSVYPDARDGWYSDPGGNFRLGLQAGVSFARHDLVLRLGQLRDVAGAPPLLPFYGTLTFVTRW